MESTRPERTEIARALGHPTRIDILSALSARTSSPSELAERLNIPLHQVVYHVRRLRELGWIELVEERKVRGTVKHFYRRMRRGIITTEEWAGYSQAQRDSFTALVLRRTWSDIEGAVNAGSFDRRDDRHLSYTQLVLDEQGWLKLVSLVDGLVERALDIAAEALERAAAGESQADIATRLVLMQFEAAERTP